MFRNSAEPPIVLSIGGSLVSKQDGPDIEFLKELNIFIRKHVAEGRRFFLVVGGGKIARNYIDAGRSVISGMAPEDMDWLGVHATHLNGHLIRSIFQDIAHPRVIQSYDRKLVNWKESLVIGAGWKPGWSTDYCATMLAKDYGAAVIINLSNIDYVYDSDPYKNPNAKPIKYMTWGELEQFVGTQWSPGLSAPFDPIATQLAKRHNLTVVIASGQDFNNLDKVITGDAFKGTVVAPCKVNKDYFDADYYHGKKAGYRFFNSRSIWAKITAWVVGWYRALTIKIWLNPKSCLDIGCGTGGLVRRLRTLGIDAYGSEISDAALELNHPSSVQYIKIGDITSLPFEENEFDCVVSFDVLEHIDRGQIEKAVNESIRVARKFVLHKIYTRENGWQRFFHRPDYGRVSIFPAKYWQKLFLAHEDVTLQRSGIFRLPRYFESLYLLKVK